MRLARDISNLEITKDQFLVRAEALVQQYPEYLALSWVDELVEYVHTIFNLLNDDVTRSSAQASGEYRLGTLRPDTCTIAVLYDPDALREAKTFQGYIELVCTEITE